MPEPFKLAGLKAEIPVIEDLSNTERALLRSLAEPGNPLWKILRSLIDYRDGLTQSLLTIDFGSTEMIETGRKIQATALAIVWLEEVLAAALTDVEEHEEKTEENT